MEMEAVLVEPTTVALLSDADLRVVSLVYLNR